MIDIYIAETTTNKTK